MARRSPAILLVEDNPIHAIFIKDSLKAAGIDVVYIVEDGQEALSFIYQKGNYIDPTRTSRPQLILLDISIPKVDGFQVLERLKKDDEYKGIPIVMLTCTDRQEAVEKCYQLGANAYIVKSVDLTEFKERIKKLGAFISILGLPNRSK